ncbi:dynamin family protein, partial [Actinoplanes subglobosus]
MTVMPTPAISGLADRFDPETSAASLGVLQQLDRAVGRPVRDDLRERLQQASAALAEPEVRIAFGGRFNSGKSSLLNVLIGRPLLPTGALPETGVACMIRAGKADELLALTGGRFVSLGFDRAVIAEQVSLIDSSGTRRDRVREVSHLAVTVSGGRFPGGLLLVDSPGVDENPEMDERATAEARAGDLLIWVVDSRSPLSETEQDFLAAHLDTHGPHSVVFVVNAFLKEDTEEGWQRFHEKVAPFCRLRLSEVADELDADPPEPVFVSARAAAAHPDRFGGPELRDLLADLAAGHRATVATRLFRAEQALADISVDMNRRTAAAEEAAARASAEHAARVLTADRMRQQLAARVNDIVYGLVAQAQSQVGAAAADAIREINNLPLKEGRDYAVMIDRNVRASISELAERIRDNTFGVARDLGHHGLGDDGIRALRDRLAPGPISVFVPTPPPAPPAVRIGGAVLGGAVGLIAGPFGLGAGAVFGERTANAISGKAGLASAREA